MMMILIKMKKMIITSKLDFAINVKLKNQKSLATAQNVINA